MNLSASLTRAEIDKLSDFEKKPLRHAGQDLHEATLLSGKGEESTFERSLRIKNTLDALEVATQQPVARALSIFINCEYQLWLLNLDTPLRHNPFLSHWAEAIQRLDRRDSPQARASSKSTTEEINTARVLWIKTLLQQQTSLKHWEDLSPSQVYESLSQTGLSTPFNIRPYIEMLEDEGIYEKSAEASPVKPAPPAQRDMQAHTDDRSLTLKSGQQPPEDALQRQKEDILEALDSQRNAAIFEITRLPIAIPYLDFLTTLLADRTLERHSIDPAPIVTQYIQHALRSIERAERPPSPSSQAETDVDHGVEMDGEMEYGKDAQTRYIRLLLLFVKSLIRKGLVELDVLYYEIAEITVRYVWIKEVRDFKRWAEEGIEQDGDD